jgi:nucleoside-diphosphate-sugar epimerase
VADVGALTRVLVTGHNGYIGSVLVPTLLGEGYEVVGLDSYLFADCTFGEDAPDIAALRMDIRDVHRDQLNGFDAVIHLAGLCNDPLGDLDPDCTLGINHRATVNLAEEARAAGVQRFLFSSSCSLYGAVGDDLVGEEQPANPVTPYGLSKICAEEDLSRLAGDDFSPTFLRNPTAYGVSTRLRGDLVVNNLAALAFTTGEALIKSDGTPWRPLAHVEDIARAFVAVLDAPRDRVHNEAFNVGSTEENYRIRDVASIVEEVIPGSRVTYAPGGGPDPRCYRVSCHKIAETLPDYRPRWTVRSGVEELFGAFQRNELTYDLLTGPRLMRIRHIQDLLATGRLDATLRWSGSSPTSVLPEKAHA